MELTITPQSIITAFAFVTAAIGLIVFFVKLVRWVDKLNALSNELEKLKQAHTGDIVIINTELTVICYSLLAALDGLKQLGANGNVSEAYEKLEKHLNTMSHK
mgnify:CR=1 FL=1